MSKIISIKNEKGCLEKISLLCTFTYLSCDYAVFRYDGDSRIYARMLYSDVWRDIVIADGRIDKEESDFVRFLLDKNRTNNEKYPLNGEHYSIYEKTTVEGKKVTKVSRRESLPGLGFKGKIFSGMLEMLFSFFLTVNVCIFYLSFCKFYPITLFPGITNVEMVKLVFFIGIFGNLLLFFLCRKCRSTFNLLKNSILPLGVLSIIVGFMRLVWVRVVLVIAVVASIILVFTPREEAQEKRDRIDSYKIYGAFSLPFLLLTVIVITAGFTGSFKEDVVIQAPPSFEEVTERYATAMENIRDGGWDTLDNKTRQGVLQAIADYECRYILGINPVDVTITDLGAPSLHGLYNDSERSISINSQYVDETNDLGVLSTLLHEVRHAWQYRVAQMYDDVKPLVRDTEYQMLSMIRDAIILEKSINDPYMIDVTYAHYLSTAMEEDARRWSDMQILTTYAGYFLKRGKEEPES